MNIINFLRSKAFWVIGALLLAGAIALPVSRSQAAADCDNNAVIHCGIDKGNEAGDKAALNAALQTGDTASIYSAFGISANQATVNSAHLGTVTKDGKVLDASGNVVATNVWSAGRQNIPGSVQIGSVWMRPTSVSFLSNSLPALVNTDGGHFNWAVVLSCGNPVKTINKPFGEIFKRVVDTTTNPNTDFAADDAAHAVEVNTGDTLKYLVRINNAGTSDMTNVNYTDNLPAGVALSSGGSGNIAHNLGTIAAGGSILNTITVKVTAGAGSVIDNKACFTANENQSGCDHAFVKVKGTTPQCTNNCTPPCTVNCTPPCTVNCTPPCTVNCTTPQCVSNCTTTPPNVGGGTLPQSGPEGAAAGVFGTGVLGYAVDAYRKSKKGLIDALKNRQ